METLTLTPVGIIHSAHTEPARTPIQSVCAPGSAGRIEIFPEYEEALTDIEGFSHLHLIYWLHRTAEATNALSGARSLKVVPFLDDVPHGIFATRSPIRPNPIGLSVVRLIERRGPELMIEDVDVLDGTPLLDIKPYVEGFDLRLGSRGGWTERVSGEEFVRRGERRRED
jgi:tRNA-Thr(GGU) m(6)t(6)A37 methyltransferase TsaA